MPNDTMGVDELETLLKTIERDLVIVRALAEGIGVGVLYLAVWVSFPNWRDSVEFFGSIFLIGGSLPYLGALLRRWTAKKESR